MITKLLSTLRRFALPLLIFYVLLITGLSLISLPSLPEINTGYDDKIYHGLAYAVYVVILFNYLEKLNIQNAIWFACISCFIYGIVIEMLQEVLNTNRTFDVLDMVANGVGIIIGFYIIKGLYKLKLN
jgi:glycopeptide antibiotics resistance protein